MDLRAQRLVNALRESLAENVGLKLVSVVIAVMLFASVRGAGNVQRSLEVPATYVLPAHMPGNPVVLSTLPDKVRVTVRGAPSALGSLRPDDLGPIQLDLREGRPRYVRLERDAIELPAGATFVSFTPAVLSLQWDTLVERALPLRTTVVGALPPRTRVEHVEVEPAQVRVRGATLYVDPLVTVHTEPVDASGLEVGRYERRIPLEPLRAGVECDNLQGARVSFEIVPVIYERRFERVPVSALGGARAQLRPPVIDVVVRGDPAAVDGLLPSQVVALVDLRALGAVREPTDVQVELRPLPEGVTVSARVPSEVLVVPPR